MDVINHNLIIKLYGNCFLRTCTIITRNYLPYSRPILPILNLYLHRTQNENCDYVNPQNGKAVVMRHVSSKPPLWGSAVTVTSITVTSKINKYGVGSMKFIFKYLYYKVIFFIIFPNVSQTDSNCS